MNPTNNATNSIQKIPEVINKASSGLILLPLNPTVDAIAAATALYIGLSKIGKSVSIASSNPIQSDLAGADKIQTDMATGGDNLVISFPYSEGSIDKVDYGVQGNYFNIIISPRAGYQKLEPQKVKYSYTGGKIEFIITIDSPNLNTLGQIYAENQSEFQGKPIINIDRHLVNDLYGTVNYVNKTSSSTSELVLKVLQVLQTEIDKEMATNLYTGISSATNNFTSYSVNADTFEAAAVLLKAGALKKIVQPKKFGSPIQPHFNPQPRPMQIRENQRPIEDVELESAGQPEAPAPQDWLKPKIFKGGGLV